MIRYEMEDWAGYRTDVFLEIFNQLEKHGKGEELTLHEFLGLIQEEFLEMVQAINETAPNTKTDKADDEGGLVRVYEEGIQTVALMTRFLLKTRKILRGEKNGDDV